MSALMFATEEREFLQKDFVEEFNFTFHKPKYGTSEKYEKYAIVMKTVNNQEICIQLQRISDEHVKLAESAYK
jgi:hypothetical protein